MRWTRGVRDRARARLTSARQVEPPPFRDDDAWPGRGAGPAGAPVLMVDQGPTIDDGIPHGVRVAAAWAWRVLLFLATAYLLIRAIGLLRVVVIPVVVALLLAALFEPAARSLRRAGVNRSVAATLVLVGGLTVVFGSLSLIVRTFLDQFDDLSAQVSQGIDEVQRWLTRGPLHVTETQLSTLIERLQRELLENQARLTAGALNTATTVGEVLAGFFLVLFTLFFFLRDGAGIWRFLCGLLPRAARRPVARAGHYSWYTLTSYVRATVLVAFVDAAGIGIGLAVLGVPLALPLAALVFLGAFVPVVGATLSGAVAVLVTLVTQGPVSALIVLGVVIAVQQVEGNVLQPLIMGRAVALHPLAILLAIATGAVLAGVIGALVAVPLLAVANTAVRYLSEHPSGEPTPDRNAPGTRPSESEDGPAEDRREERPEEAPAG